MSVNYLEYLIISSTQIQAMYNLCPIFFALTEFFPTFVPDIIIFLIKSTQNYYKQL